MTRSLPSSPAPKTRPDRGAVHSQTMGLRRRTLSYTVCLPSWEFVLRELDGFGGEVAARDFNAAEKAFERSRDGMGTWIAHGPDGCSIEIAFEEHEGYLFGTLRGRGAAFYAAGEALHRAYIEAGGSPEATEPPPRQPLLHQWWARRRTHSTTGHGGPLAVTRSPGASIPPAASDPMRKAIPWCLVLSRPLLGLIGILVALLDWPRWIWLVQFVAAIASDIWDGKLARRWGVATERLRRADSICDDIYAYASLACFWIAEPSIVAAHAPGLLALIAVDVLRMPVDWLRFRKRASYHATSMRLFGLSLIPVGILLMMRGDVHWVLWASLGVGMYAELEGLAMTLVLPRWTCDVPHLGAALEIRRRAQAAGDPRA